MTDLTRKDLELMLFFLEKGKDGIGMNLLVFRKPVKVYRSDSCPAGMGGYSSDGFPWRWYIPEHLKFRASNNLLEHLASIVSPWIDMCLGRLQKGDCFLSMTESTTAEGWSKKSNFSELGKEPIQAEVRNEVCREYAKRKFEFKVKDYTLPPVVPRCARRSCRCSVQEYDRSDEELTKIMNFFCTSQIPSHFKIVSLPAEISSYLVSMPQKLPVNAQSQENTRGPRYGMGQMRKILW